MKSNIIERTLKGGLDCFLILSLSPLALDPWAPFLYSSGSSTKKCWLKMNRLCVILIPAFCTVYPSIQYITYREI